MKNSKLFCLHFFTHYLLSINSLIYSEKISLTENNFISVFVRIITNSLFLFYSLSIKLLSLISRARLPPSLLVSLLLVFLFNYYKNFFLLFKEILSKLYFLLLFFIFLRFFYRCTIDF